MKELRASSSPPYLLVLERVLPTHGESIQWENVHHLLKRPSTDWIA